jgi:hypothetical protein
VVRTGKDGRWLWMCVSGNVGVGGMERKEGKGLDIDEGSAAASRPRAHALVTPVVRHTTCPRHGKMASETSSLCSNDAGWCLQFTSDKPLVNELSCE